MFDVHLSSRQSHASDTGPGEADGRSGSKRTKLHRVPRHGIHAQVCGVPWVFRQVRHAAVAGRGETGPYRMAETMNSGDDDIFPQFMTDLIELEKSGAGMPFIFTPWQAFFLLGTLQLALRHPELETHYAAHVFITGLAKDIEKRIGKTDALKEVAARGWR